jgi:hypothetical protein
LVRSFTFPMCFLSCRWMANWNYIH